MRNYQYPTKVKLLFVVFVTHSFLHCAAPLELEQCISTTLAADFLMAVYQHKAPPVKSRWMTEERLDKFISTVYFSDVNLQSRFVVVLQLLAAVCVQNNYNNSS